MWKEDSRCWMEDWKGRETGKREGTVVEMKREKRSSKKEEEEGREGSVA